MAGTPRPPAVDPAMPDRFRARFDAALFDMDGLLIDSEPYWTLAEREAFAEVGIEITDAMGVQAAVRAGMTVVAVPSAGQAFREASHPPHFTVPTLADFCRVHRSWTSPA